MAENYWMVCPGAQSKIASQFREKSVVAIGWPLLGDISRLTTQDDVQERYRQNNPDLTPRQVGYWASSPFKFLNQIAEGDVVVMPVPDAREVWLGRVRGPYQFDEQVISPDYPHVRRVDWVKQLPYESISSKLRASIRSGHRVFSLQDKHAVEVRSLVERPDEALKSQVYILPQQRLTRVHFQRFKAFEERVDVDLAPVTLIAGVNSSGKTTILQSLLLARQTLTTLDRSAVEDALKYDGDLVRAVYFHELVFGKPDQAEKGIRLGFTVKVRTSSPAVYEYFGGLPQDAGELSMNVDLDAQFDYDSGREVVIVSQIVLTARIHHDQVDCQEPTLTIEPHDGARWQLDLQVGTKSRGILEDGFIVNRFIPAWEIHNRPHAQSVNRRYIYEAFRNLFFPAMDLLRSELEERLFYVGPSRSAPQRPYVRQSVIGLDVGTSGEAAVQLLRERWENKVAFVELPDDLTHFSPMQAKPKQMQVGQAVQEALRLLGMEQQLRIKKQGAAYEAELSLLSKSAEYVSIVEVGFGVSQILPIIAVSLLSPVDSILIFEQPEIHLHPRAQAGLGELFLCLARTGRRVLVETHGDHLINRLRRRMAEDETGELKDWVNILFVHTPESAGQGATVRSGHIDRYGDIENWPPGFLAESAKDARAIMMAASTKRLKEKAQGQSQ